MMTNIEKFLRGIQIIMKYESDPDIAAEHDIFYCGSTDHKMSDEDEREMARLGWFEGFDSHAFYV